MALTKEDLQAIKSMLDPRFDKLEEGFNGIRGEFNGLKEDVSELKEDVSRLEDNVSRLNADMDEVKKRLTKIEVVQLENYLIPKVEEITAYQKSVYERYTRNADRFEEKIQLIDTTANTVEDHSKQIQELQLKQA